MVMAAACRCAPLLEATAEKAVSFGRAGDRRISPIADRQ